MAQANALRQHMTGTSTGITQHTGKPTTLAHLLADPKIKAQIALALPKHMTADRLARIALTEVRKNPKLAQCDQASFLGAIMQLASLGLEPGGALGHAYLIPFDKRGKLANGQWGVIGTDVQLVIGYRGMLDLARRSGQIMSLEARAVYERDFFEVELGLDSRITHKPDWSAADRGELTFVYAVAKLRDGGMQFDVMSRAELESIRDRSQGYKAAVSAAERYKKPIDSPWASYFEEMAKKTILRRLFKYLPVSIEMQRAVGLDEQGDAGARQDNPLVIEADYSIQQAELAAEHAEAMAVGNAAESLTMQEVHDAIAAATTRDALDEAAALIDLTPEADRAGLHVLYGQRQKVIEEGKA